METDNISISFRCNLNMKDEIEEYEKNNNYMNMSDAVRDLIRRGLRS